VAGVREVWLPGGVRTEIHVRGADTDDAFCLLVDEPPEGWALPSHRHADEDETIHVLEGDFDVEIDGDTSRLTPGRTIHIPRGAWHSSRNAGRRAGRRIVIFSPAGMERLFTEIGRAAPDAEFDLREVIDAAERHGWEFAG
jgi:quercetin dioxygenase-like cupin family protein